MKLKIILLFINIVFISCGQVKDYDKNPNKDPRKNTSSNKIFEKYVDEFEKEYGNETNIPINFGNLKDGIAGICYSWTTGYREIEINKDNWDNLSYNQKNNLIFHELGHCELDRNHKNTTNNGCPISFMNYNMMSDNCLDLYWNNLIEEMF